MENNIIQMDASQSFRLIMENNIIQMAALADHAVAYTSGLIFKHIIEWLHE